MSLLLAEAAPAAAYVRARSLTTNVAWFWNHGTLNIAADVVQPVRSMSQQELTTAINEAAAAWGRERNSCTSARITISTTDDPDGPVKADQVFRLVFRRPDWCRSPAATMVCNGETLALTTTSFNPVTGEIIDADIEVNATAIVWSDRVRRPGANYDLQNALTHEMGHFLGFGHSCVYSGKDTKIDFEGKPVAPCYMVGEQALESTLYPTSDVDDIARRTLTEDDLRGLCEVYPAHPGTSLEQTGGPIGCSMVRSRPAPATLLAMLAIVLWRRKRKTPGPSPR
jgi:hypothetical protein